MRSDDFDFDLPRKLIAQHPAVPRDAARLLVIGDALEDRGVRDLPALLRPGDVLVVNDTRVIPTRLFGRRGTANVEVTLIEPGAPARGGARWHAFARPAKRLKPGDRVDFGPGLSANVAAKGERGEVSLAFDLGGRSFAAPLQRRGPIPLPPNKKRARGGDPPDPDD